MSAESFRSSGEILRRAGVADAAALAHLAESTFRIAFAATNTPANMDAHCASTYGEEIQARELADPAVEVWVAEQGGALHGYAQLRWLPPPSCIRGQRAMEIHRFYVVAARHGSGLAQRLMERSFDAARAGGADVVWLGVWEHNPRAIAFYGKHGFTEVGSHIFQVGDDPQRDLLFTRPP